MQEEDWVIRVPMSLWRCFCGTRRYPEMHVYKIDWKEIGREILIK